MLHLFLYFPLPALDRTDVFINEHFYSQQYANLITLMTFFSRSTLLLLAAVELASTIFFYRRFAK